jgi:preprotein translocase subunit YajC
MKHSLAEKSGAAGDGGASRSSAAISRSSFSFRASTASGMAISLMRGSPAIWRGQFRLLVAMGVLLTIFATNFQGVPRHASTEYFMFVTPAYAQAAGGSAGGADVLMSVLPFILIFVVMYFLIIRPQRTQMKKREEMLKSIRRNDTVVTGGGIIGKVTKVVDDHEVEVEIAQNVKIRVARAMISEVRVKGEPVAANDTAKK